MAQILKFPPSREEILRDAMELFKKQIEVDELLICFEEKLNARGGF